MDQATVDRLFRKLDRIEGQQLAQAEMNGSNAAQRVEMAKALVRIETQTVKTNGRVTVLEGKWTKAVGALMGASVVSSLVFKVFL